MTRRVKILGACLALGEPRFEAATFSELQSGTELELLGEEGGFYKVALLGRPAYVAKQYAAPSVEAASLTAQPAGISAITLPEAAQILPIVVAACAGLVIVGSFSPWATVYFRTMNGMDSDGKFTLLLAAGALVALYYRSRNTNQLRGH